MTMFNVSGMYDYKQQRSGKESDAVGDVSVPSESCLFLQHLAYFERFNFNAPVQSVSWMKNTLDVSNIEYWTPGVAVSSLNANVGILWTKVS